MYNNSRPDCTRQSQPSPLKRPTWLAAMAMPLLIIGCGGGIGGIGDSTDESDPLALDRPIAYVKRALPTDDDDNVISDDILEPGNFSLRGAGLYTKVRPTLQASETNITDRAFPAGSIYDVKDVEVSSDGSRLVFAMRGPLDPDEDDEDNQPKWNLWLYDSDTDVLEPVIQDPIIAEGGNDISPDFLPNGNIIFTSDRQVRSRAILIDEIKPDDSVNGAGFSATVDDEEIYNLHSVNPVDDPLGANIQQLTFNQGHDLQPTVLSNGRIAFLRYDASDSRDNLSIYTINIDGSNLRILYGYHSQTTGNSGGDTTFIDFRELADGTLGAILQPRDTDRLGGDIIRINAQGFTDINQPTNDNAGDTGTAQSTLSFDEVDLSGGISQHGYFNSAYAFFDDRNSFLVSWGCNLQDPDTGEVVGCDDGNLSDPDLVEANPQPGVWLYNSSSGTQRPVAPAAQGQMFTDVVIMEPRNIGSIPLAIADSLDTDLAGQGLAILNIRSVYDTDGVDTATGGIATVADPQLTTAAEREARFIRIVKAVSIPDEDTLDFDNSAFGINQQRGMREIIGYAPIEPDGSVRALVPADVAFYFDIVNADGERIMPLHRNWIHLRAGEAYQCRGCHLGSSELPHGRDGSVNSSGQPIYSAEAPSVNLGGVGIGVHFLNTVFSSVDDVVDGETMAEVYAKAPDNSNPNGARPLTTGLIYTDDWTDPAVRTPDADYSLLYAGNTDFAGITTAPPASSGCQTNWQVGCRTVINYVDHIQPLWETNRLSGADNNQCIACHSRTDAIGNDQTPAGQLELTNLPSAAEPDHFTSYRALLQQSAPLIASPDGNGFLPLFVFNIVNGVQQFYEDAGGNLILDVGGNPIPLVRAFSPDDDNLSDIRVQSFTGTDPDFYLDAVGAQILDAGGNPIEVTVSAGLVDAPPAMRLSDAAGSRFFDEMTDATNTVDHTNFMSPNELRLLREWLDIGGQYYNNPFDAPLN